MGIIQQLCDSVALLQLQHKISEANIARLEERSIRLGTIDQVCIHASGSGLADGSVRVERFSTLVRDATGRWSVVFDAPHPDGDGYEVLFGQSESGTLRDVAKTSVVEGTRTATGFLVQTTVDDNGGTADTLSNDSWSFAVMKTGRAITEVTFE